MLCKASLTSPTTHFGAVRPSRQPLARQEGHGFRLQIPRRRLSSIQFSPMGQRVNPPLVNPTLGQTHPWSYRLPWSTPPQVNPNLGQPQPWLPPLLVNSTRCQPHPWSTPRLVSPTRGQPHPCSPQPLVRPITGQFHPWSILLLVISSPGHPLPN